MCNVVTQRIVSWVVPLLVTVSNYRFELFVLFLIPSLAVVVVVVMVVVMVGGGGASKWVFFCSPDWQACKLLAMPFAG